MSLLNELSSASYKGVSFLTTSSKITGGRKDVKHSFPNSNKQTIEDLGLSPRAFQMSASIIGQAVSPVIGEQTSTDYIQRRDAFLRVLEEGGPGPLVHPFYGRLENYVARTYTLLENLTELGEAKFLITFEISNIIGVPIAAETTLNTINKFNDLFIGSCIANLEDNYTVTPSFLGNFGSAVDKMNDVVTEFKDNISFLQVAANEINTFSRKINSLETNILTLVQQPRALVDSITGLFFTVNNLYPTIEATLAVFAGFFDFGDNDTTINITTASLAERKTNDDIINATIIALPCSYTYLNASQVIYTTVEDIEEVADTLEIQYQKVISKEGLSDETKSTLTDLRVETQKFFDQQKLTVRQIIDINTNLTSARLLAYQYYGDSSQGEELALLNNVDDVTFIEGDIEVLTE